MKSPEEQFVIGRRNALKILGLSSAALFTGVLGGIPTAQAAEIVKNKKTIVPSGKSPVSFATGTDRRAMMFEVLKPFDQEIRKGLKGKQLIIKPNMVSTSAPLCATHVDALRSLIEYVKPFYSGQIIIAEASAGNGISSAGFKNYGYLDLQNDYNIKFVDINLTNGSPFWILDRNLHLEKILITDVFLNPNNYIISISRLKTHNTVIMTAGTKNMVMAAPLNIPAADEKPQMNYKSKMHSGGPRFLHYNMFLMAQKVKANLTIIDGLEGMEGNGPSRGTATDHRIAMAGFDVVAIDTMCAKLMGIPLENIGYLNYCADNGLGITDINKIEILGNQDPNKYVIPYKLSDNIASQMEWKEDLVIKK